jgi:hypothetical protein
MKVTPTCETAFLTCCTGFLGNAFLILLAASFALLPASFACGHREHRQTCRLAYWLFLNEFVWKTAHSLSADPHRVAMVAVSS